jgi:hypothetical protein
MINRRPSSNTYPRVEDQVSLCLRRQSGSARFAEALGLFQTLRRLTPISPLPLAWIEVSRSIASTGAFNKDSPLSTKTENVSFVHPLQSRWEYVALLFLLAGVVLSAFKLPNPYSYWADELYSVTLSHESLMSLHRILLSDLHPPLYQLLLKGWIIVFGDSEFSTRSLSWLFAVASIYPLWKFSRSYGVVFFVSSLVVFSTNVLFTFYANESRPYAMELFFATLVSKYYFEEINKRVSPKFLIACLALSLSHYFGLILVGVILGFRLFENRTDRGNAFKILGTGILAGLWPLHHALNGLILGKTGGNFSIKINGYTDSFGLAASGFMSPFGINYSSRSGAYLLIGGIVGAMLIVLYGRLRSGAIDDNLNLITLRLALVLGCFLFLVASIDLFSPMSRSRYYIVILPLVTLLMAGVLQIVSRNSPLLKNALLVLVCVYSSLALFASFGKLNYKANPREDWKGASQFIVKNYHGENLYFVKEDYRVWVADEASELWREMICNFYLRKESGGRLSAIPFTIGETAIKRPAWILYGHNHGSFKQLSEEMKQSDAIQVYPFSGDSEGYATGVYFLK